MRKASEPEPSIVKPMTPTIAAQTAVAPSALAFSRTMRFEYGVAREIAPGVRRVVANNPGPYTFKGTNTYIVGRGEVAVIDPGPADPKHLSALAAATMGERVTHILITHTHRDHTDAVAAFKASTGAKVYAYGHTPAPRGATTDHPAGKGFVDLGFKPDITLRDGDSVRGRGWMLDVLHTPGHAPDHLCFALVGRRTMFSGDHVMGWNTTVVAPPEGKMSDYLSSLERLLARNDKLFLPGHGGRIETPQRVVKAYMMHRKWREAAIYNCLQEGRSTIPQIVAKIYAGLETNLVPAAALSVLAHLEHLVERGLVACDRAPDLEARFSPV